MPEARLTECPCPCCAQSLNRLPLKRHLRACGALSAMPADDAALAAVRVRMLALEHRVAVRSLGMLARACERFNSELGYNGQYAYARSYDEKLWDAARRRAQRHVRFGRLERPSNVMSEASTALIERVCRGVAEGVRPRAEDEARLREIAASLKDYAQQYGRCVACAFCGRPGTHSADLGEHLLRCIRNPAIERMRAAIGTLPPGVWGEGISRMDPHDTSFDHRIAGIESHEGGSYDEESLQRDYWEDKFFRDLLNDLFKEKPYLGQMGRYTLEARLAEWERFEAATLTACSACGKDHDLEDLCAMHPLRDGLDGERDGERWPKIAALRIETDRFWVQLAKLLDACHALSTRMGEDERFRSEARNVADLEWWQQVIGESVALVTSGSVGTKQARWAGFQVRRHIRLAEERAVKDVTGKTGLVPDLELTPLRARFFWRELRREIDERKRRLPPFKMRGEKIPDSLAWELNAWERVQRAFDLCIHDKSEPQVPYTEDMSTRLARGLDAAGAVTLSAYFDRQKRWWKALADANKCEPEQVDTRDAVLDRASDLFHALLGLPPQGVADSAHRVPKLQPWPRLRGGVESINGWVIEERNEAPITKDERRARESFAMSRRPPLAGT